MLLSRAAASGLPSSMAALIDQPAITPSTSAIKIYRVSRLAIDIHKRVSRVASSFTGAERVARGPTMAADRSPAIGVLEFGRAILHDEARALDALADQLGVAFEKAVELICR